MKTLMMCLGLWLLGHFWGSYAYADQKKRCRPGSWEANCEQQAIKNAARRRKAPPSILDWLESPPPQTKRKTRRTPTKYRKIRRRVRVRRRRRVVHRRKRTRRKARAKVAKALPQKLADASKKGGKANKGKSEPGWIPSLPTPKFPAKTKPVKRIVKPLSHPPKLNKAKKKSLQPPTLRKVKPKSETNDKPKKLILGSGDAPSM